MTLDIYTDGSSYYKDGTGGWAFVVVRNDLEIYQNFGNKRNTTISVMEMLAVYNSMKYIKRNFIDKNKKVKVRIFCDSAFVVNTFLEKWYIRWREMEWYGVKNSKLWRKILDLYFTKGMNIEFVKIKGHSGNKWNDIADFYAGSARKILNENS